MKEVVFFALGAVFGAILALLFAPQSGEELRTKIQETSERDWQKIQGEWQADQEKVHQGLDKIQQTLQKQELESKGAEEA